MSAGESLSQMQFEHIERRGEHVIVAHHPEAPSGGWDNHAGHLSWFADNGEVGGVEVHPDFQRRGLATEMWRQARELQPDLHHSEALTPDGQAWARKVH